MAMATLFRASSHWIAYALTKGEKAKMTKGNNNSRRNFSNCKFFNKTTFPEINSPSSWPRGVFVVDGRKNMKHSVPAYERLVTKRSGEIRMR